MTLHPEHPPINVSVHANGQVWVNGILAAELIVGPYDPANPHGVAADKTVVTRDDLAHQLALHRIADVVAQRLGELVRYLGSDGANNRNFVTVAERPDFGAGLVAGLLGEPGELTGRQPYRDGHRAGTTLRALRDHLDAALTEGAST